jgi:hypothetical protein
MQGGNMDRELFLQAKTFIFSDIQREIALAKASQCEEKQQLLEELRIIPGGGNFLAALGLLCYTEFAGGLKNGDFSPGKARANFNSFFDELGPEYKAFNARCDVYGDLRCGLVHEYYVKKRCLIAMSSSNQRIGVRWDGSRYVFIVEQYFDDFKRAFLRLENTLSWSET